MKVAYKFPIKFQEEMQSQFISKTFFVSLLKIGMPTKFHATKWNWFQDMNFLTFSSQHWSRPDKNRRESRHSIQKNVRLHIASISEAHLYVAAIRTVDGALGY